jgi:hypothetical protein
MWLCGRFVSLPARRFVVTSCKKNSCKKISCTSVWKFAVYGFKLTLMLCFVAGCFAHGQTYYPEKEVHVNLPAVTARSVHSADVLAASLEMVFHDKVVCCGRDSALEDALQYVDAKSLKDVSSKLQGRHVLSDGRATTVTAEYLTPDQVGAGHMIAMMQAGHAALMQWNGRVYVVDGLTYAESVSAPSDQGGGGELVYVVHKFLLEDPRYGDEKRAVVFDRTTEDISKVQGLLFLQATTE